MKLRSIHSVSVFSDQAIVLRAQKLGEADRIITLLTKAHGQRRAVAKGVRKPSSRFGGRLEPFSIVAVQCYEGRTLDNVTQAEGIHIYGPALSQDYEAYAAANAVCETALQLTEADAGIAHYNLVAGVLGALVKGIAPAAMLLSSYILRALAVAGWGLQIRNCAACGRSGKFSDFSLEMGGVLCPDCALTGTVKLTISQLELLDALQHGQWQLVNAAAGVDQDKVAALVTAFLNWHLERRLKSLQVEQ